jgi:hypothetical protein
MSDAPGSCAGDDEVVAIVSCAIAPGLATARALRAKSASLYGPVTGPVHLGIGLDVDRIAELPRSYYLPPFESRADSHGTRPAHLSGLSQLMTALMLV